MCMHPGKFGLRFEFRLGFTQYLFMVGKALSILKQLVTWPTVSLPFAIAHNSYSPRPRHSRIARHRRRQSWDHIQSIHQAVTRGGRSRNCATLLSMQWNVAMLPANSSFAQQPYFKEYFCFMVCFYAAQKSSPNLGFKARTGRDWSTYILCYKI